jgi:lysozyme
MPTEILRNIEVRTATVSQELIDLVVFFECSGNVGNFLNAYLDPVGIPTIGVGTTFYPDGSRVRIGDTCTTAEAYDFFRHEISSLEKKIDSLTRDDITQGMFDSLVDFGYNVGIRNLQSSTLLKKVNANPIDFAAIAREFNKWGYSRKRLLNGLIKRRKCEAYLYRNGINAPGFIV